MADADEEGKWSMRVKVAFVFFLILATIAGLSAVNIFIRPCVSRLDMAQYNEYIEEIGEEPEHSRHEIRIEKSQLSEIVERLDEFWKPYNVSDPKYFPCDKNNPPPENKTCQVNLDDFSSCRRRGNYGLSRSEPCVFFRFRADTEWIPEMYKEDEFPENMPQDLTAYAREWMKYPLEAIWFSCDGVYERDRENMGSLLYLPHRGFLSYYFPCKRDDLCTHPVLAVQFIRPKKKVIINMKCKVWVKNNIEKINFSLYVE